MEGFLAEWASYCELVEGQVATSQSLGRNLDSAVKEQLSEEQQKQLEQLQAAVHESTAGIIVGAGTSGGGSGDGSDDTPSARGLG